MKCAVVGAGAWGTALASLLSENGHETTLWAFEPDVAEAVNVAQENPRFLAGILLHPELRATTDRGEAVDGAQCVIYATPSHVLRDVASSMEPWTRSDATLVVATKGIERGRLALMTDVIAEQLPGRPVVALSGPSFASEVARRLPTAIVAASDDHEAALRVQEACSSPSFRVYTHDDVIGVELGGALKNVMAVATGICDGLELGLNARAALITRGLAEIMRLGLTLGARPQTFAGLAGIGDLVLTCTGALSRNRSVGLEIGRGASLAEVLSGRETVAEGVVTTESAKALSEREGVEMPIVNAVHRVLFERQPARWALVELMARGLRTEEDR
ncbi:MAG: NAD(P)-dependent glycerol-3-phosphate dehydrogenase [Gemmatimonadetes bacterium]|nr:NAD(P)-dependent glycerol-3-phosphate dehydrogenase [Gemmatimonadota bacterium]MBI3566869.1 NAD(P)-dependent glycerol-3-phosphate dehydrogenase [Gemmatimonadota bacterium]